MSKDVYNFEKDFPSELITLNLIEPVINEIRKFANISEDVYHNIMISVTEAVNNAVIHGNKFDKSKKVHIAIRVNSEYIYINVSDQGNGFDPSSIPDPTQGDNIFKESGRGVFLMNELTASTEFVITSEGTTVKLKFPCK